MCLYITKAREKMCVYKYIFNALEINLCTKPRYINMLHLVAAWYKMASQKEKESWISIHLKWVWTQYIVGCTPKMRYFDNLKKICDTW